jgi:hypothetical protein
MMDSEANALHELIDCRLSRNRLARQPGQQAEILETPPAEGQNIVQHCVISLSVRCRRGTIQFNFLTELEHSIV